MKRLLLFILLPAFVFISCSKTTTPAPEPTRYLEEKFGEVTIQTVVYSNVSNFEMDIYQPKGDAEKNRPVVILAHGGGFFQGSKTNPGMVRLANDLAKRGYVVGSINYSLASGITDVLDSTKALNLVVKSIGDARAAIRFFRQTAANGNVYNIDASRIYFGGNSAGAILAAHLGLWDDNDPLSPQLSTALQANGGFEGNRGNPGFSSDVKAVFSLAGAIKTTSFVDADDAPIINFHGVDDDVVPFNCGDVYSGFTNGADVINVCGSNAIHNQALVVGLESKLFTYPGKHVPWMNSTTGEPISPMFDEVEREVIAFLFTHL